MHVRSPARAAHEQITNRARNRTQYFYCGQWLDKKTGVERTLHASDTDPRKNLVTYKVRRAAPGKLVSQGR